MRYLSIAGGGGPHHLESMSAYEFTVEQRPIPATHTHTWVAIDDASGAVIDLPAGGSGAYLGRYPEIAAYLAGKGLNAILDYSRRRGDTFDADHDEAIYTFTFATAGGIVVKDIPRTQGSITFNL